MWWRLGVLALVAAIPLLLLFMPIETVDIVVEMPRARGGGSSVSTDDMEAVVKGVATAIATLLLLGYVALALWIGGRIVRKHRQGPGPG